MELIDPAFNAVIKETYAFLLSFMHEITIKRWNNILSISPFIFVAIILFKNRKVVSLFRILFEKV
jgi:hypothetical protein